MVEREDRPDIAAVQRIIAALPKDAQRRIDLIADVVRDLVSRDDTGEAELALTLVMAELSYE